MLTAARRSPSPAPRDGDPAAGVLDCGPFHPARRSASHTCARTTCGPPSAYVARSEEHTSELQSLMRISYAVFCLKKKKKQLLNINNNNISSNNAFERHTTS